MFQYPLKDIIQRHDYPSNFKVSECLLPNRQWDSLLIQELVPLDIAHIICSLFISFTEQADKLIWGLSTNEVYSVKSGALLGQGLLPSPPEVVNFRWIWKLNAALKIKKFLWKACNDGLPTKDRLE